MKKILLSLGLLLSTIFSLAASSLPADFSQKVHIGVPDSDPVILHQVDESNSLRLHWVTQDNYLYDAIGSPVATKKGGGLTDAMSEAGKKLDPADKQGKLTKAGRSLQKHGSGSRRPDSPFPPARGNQNTINQAGQDQLDDILTDPNSTVTPLGRGGTRIDAPDGRGVRFDADGSFSGFVD